MNKGRRHELKMLKYKRRLRVYAAKSKSIKAYLRGDSINVNCNGLRTTGKPCSCGTCSPYKYDRQKENRVARQQADVVHEGIQFARKEPFVSEIVPLDDDTDLPEHYYYEWD